MSTKTTFKRVALVAVASLGFGLMSAAPSSAAEVTSTIQNTTTAFSGRINNVTAIAVAVKTGAVAEVET